MMSVIKATKRDDDNANDDDDDDDDNMSACWLCRIYDPDLYRVVQTNVGHRDAVRNIIHVPERGQVSATITSHVTANWYEYMNIWIWTDMITSTTT